MPGLNFPRLGTDFGRGTTYADFNQSTLPVGAQLGTLIEDNGKIYRLVLHSPGTAVATVSGFVAHWKSKSAFTVSSDQSPDGEAGLNGIAGGYLGVVTSGNYCFIQCGGDQTSVQVVTTSATAGTLLIGSSTDGKLDIATTNNVVSKTVAVGLTTGAGGTLTVRWEPNVIGF